MACHAGGRLSEERTRECKAGGRIGDSEIGKPETGRETRAGGSET
jgi:hypothetical protein